MVGSKLLVIGGGIAGCAAVVGVRKLNKDVEIVMVEPKDHCEVYWAAFRSPFEEWVAEGSLKSLTEWAKKNKVTHIRSTVTKLTETTAYLADGSTIDYSVAVVATGASTHAPFLGRGVPAEGAGSRESRLAHLKLYGEEMLKAESILVVGGGLIGAELVGDIAAYAKEKGKTPNVTLVHSGPYLSHAELSEQAANMVLEKTEKLGVKVIFNEKVVKGKDGSTTLQKSGESIKADLVIFTTGLTPINDFLKAGDFADALDEKGWIVTDEYFRVKGAKGKLYSLGDCSTYLPNAGYQILSQIKAIGKNVNVTLRAFADDKDVPSDSTLAKGAESLQTTISTIGPHDGVFYTPGFHTQFVLPRVKNKTMFYFRVNGELGFD